MKKPKLSGLILVLIILNLCVLPVAFIAQSKDATEMGDAQYEASVEDVSNAQRGDTVTIPKDTTPGVGAVEDKNADAAYFNTAVSYFVLISAAVLEVSYFLISEKRKEKKNSNI